MRTISVVLLIAAFGIAGCGDDDGGTAAQPQSGDAAEKKDEGAVEKDGKAATITLAGSQFGQMLFDSSKQAIYEFERDGRNKTVCYGECAEAWPPVLSEGKPRAGKGVNASLLGTIKRRDGRAQVTYAGKPLYFYAHEDPGVVLCHDVNLNGGYWWVIGADGRRRPS
jgi:predicted lipoprotein with Yx(FWY)xxD motif